MKPILFNTEMVRAILEGRKTVTRRAVKPQPPATSVVRKRSCAWEWSFWADCDMGHLMSPPCQPGDILWVRETWCKAHGHYLYRAFPGIGMEPERQDAAMREMGLKWHPSIHMPKEAARLFLRVTDVRVERLQDIDDDGAKAEGANYQDGKNVGWEEKMRRTAIDRFAEIWDNTIKLADLTLYGWEANPWVWVIEFERISKDEAMGGGGDD